MTTVADTVPNHQNPAATCPDSWTASSSERSASSAVGPKRSQERFGYICLSVARMPSTIFMLTFFVPYLNLLAKHSVNETGSVSLFFASLKPSSVPTGAIMIASICSAVFCPALGALADFSPHRRTLLKTFALVCGSMFCLATLVIRQTWWVGFILLIVMFFAGQAADFLSNSYLAEVADSPGTRSQVSSSALRFGLISQVTLLLLGMAVSYMFVPHPFRPNGSQFDCPNSKGFATIRSNSFAAFDISSLEANTIESQWHHVMGETDGPVKKIVETRFKLVSWARLSVDRPATKGSHFVAFPEGSTGLSLQGRRISMNVVARADSDDDGARLRTHLLTFNHHGRNAILQSAEASARFAEPRTEHAFHLEATLPPDAHFLYYLVEVSGGPVSITRLDIMEEDVYIVPILCLVSGIWYLIWSLIGLRRLGERNSRHARHQRLPVLIMESVAGLARTIRRTASDSVLARSLLAVAFYSASVGSTLLMGPVFITEKLEVSQFLIGLTTLGTIFGTIAGALLFLQLGKRTGYNRALALAYLLWLIDMVLMFFLLREREHASWLFLTVPLMGIASGGTLTLARAVFASQIPPGFECELFGLFSFSQSLMGPFALILFLAANEILGDLQWGIASQTIFMLLAFGLQFSIREKDIASRRARQGPPESTATGASCLETVEMSKL